MFRENEPSSTIGGMSKVSACQIFPAGEPAEICRRLSDSTSHSALQKFKRQPVPLASARLAKTRITSARFCFTSPWFFHPAKFNYFVDTSCKLS
jgi:hypothetical protein